MSRHENRAICLHAALVLRTMVEYPNSERGLEQGFATRDLAYRVHDVAGFGLFDH
jgi:hypothetical protein